MAESQQPNDHLSIIKETKSLNIHHVYITNSIDDPSKYANLLQLLNTADDDDRIIMYINSPGGSLPTAMQIVNAMVKCKAPVTTVIDGVAHSAASLIFLSTSSTEVRAGSCMCCHFFSQLTWGKAHEVKANVNFMESFYKKLFDALYSGFLTDDELKRMYKGEDFWFDSEEILRRLGNRKREFFKAKKLVEKGMKIEQPKKSKKGGK